MNQNPEQPARDKIDFALLQSGWLIPNNASINLAAGIGIAVREYQINVGPADYSKGVELDEREEECFTMHEDQTEDYATANLKYINKDPLPFVYESTGELTRFTDYRAPKPRSRPVYTFIG